MAIYVRRRRDGGDAAGGSCIPFAILEKGGGSPIFGIHEGRGGGGGGVMKTTISSKEERKSQDDHEKLLLGAGENVCCWSLYGGGD